MSEDNSEPSTSKSSSEPLNIVQRNGGAVLMRAGYQYTKKKIYKSGCITWRCVKWHQKCTAYINIKENKIIKETKHQCEPDEIENMMAQKLNECREKVLSSNFSPIPRIYNDFKSEFHNAGLNLLKKLPSFASIKSSLYDARNKKVGVSKIQCNLPEEVTIPMQFKALVLVDYFDRSSNIRIIVFADKETLEHIKHIKVYLSDGTFQSCPKPFIQLYSIHGDLGSNEAQTRIVPLFYVLLNRKNEETYTTLFRLLKSHISDWEPLKYVTDEKAAMNAISTVFPLVEVKGCYFHFSHNVWKKAKALNLTKDKRLRKHVALSALLPLLPRNFISDGWCYVMEDSPESKDIQEFNDYMVTQWLDDESFVDIWCAYNQRHRTTNAVESWHKKLNSTVPKRPNLFQLLKALKDDIDLQKVMLTFCKQYNFELPNFKRRLTEAIVTDNWFEHVTNQLLSGKITVGHCLEKLKL